MNIVFGTYNVRDPNIFSMAYDIGYRHFDTSPDYYNESILGKTLLGKNAIYSSKTFLKQYGYNNTMYYLERTLKKLRIDCIDYYMIHWPVSIIKNKNYIRLNTETFKALIDAKKQGKVKYIGVSNFMPWHLKSIKTEIRPEFNQIEFHPSIKLYNYGCRLFGYNVLYKGIVKDKNLDAIAKKYNASFANILIAYAIRNGIIPIVKSTNFNHMVENISCNVSLSDEDISILDNVKLERLENPDE